MQVLIFLHFRFLEKRDLDPIKGKSMNEKVYPMILNLCDEPSFTGVGSLSEYIEQCKQNLEIAGLPFSCEIKGIRIGAETCGQLYSSLKKETLMDLSHKAREKNLSVSLVTPVFEQTRWEKAKQLTGEILTCQGADQLVVNDFGMFEYLENRRERKESCQAKILLGRLFDKRFRDPRFDLSASNTEEGIWDTPAFRELCKREKITGAECELLDNGFQIPDKSLPFYVHMPYTLVSQGNICEYSGIGLEENLRFKPGNCKKQCLFVTGRARHSVLKKMVYKHGNGLYMRGHLTKRNLECMQKGNITLIYTDYERR